jgi:hypothetical protein
MFNQRLPTYDEISLVEAAQAETRTTCNNAGRLAKELTGTSDVPARDAETGIALGCHSAALSLAYAATSSKDIPDGTYQDEVAKMDANRSSGSAQMNICLSSLPRPTISNQGSSTVTKSVKAIYQADCEAEVFGKLSFSGECTINPNGPVLSIYAPNDGCVLNLGPADDGFEVELSSYRDICHAQNGQGSEVGSADLGWAKVEGKCVLNEKVRVCLPSHGF